MNKKDILKIAAVIVVLGFFTEMFFSGAGYNAPNAPSGSNITGMATFSGSIRTYDPVLLLVEDPGQEIMEQLRMHEGVRNVRADMEGILVETETRDDVYPVAAFLRKANITTYAIANIAATQEVVVETALGKMNATPAYGVIRLYTEPVVEPDTEVTVAMIAIVNSGFIIDYHSAAIQMREETVLFDAEVLSLTHKTYRYSIPWEERNSLGDLSGYDAEYLRVDSMTFTAPLSVGQILSKKHLSYIKYIDASSAQVSPDFNDTEMLAEDFRDAEYRLPDSSLTIRSDQDPDIPFQAEVAYRYLLEMPDTGDYEFGIQSLEMETDEELDGTIALQAEVLVVGNKVVSVRSVSLPS